MSETVSIAFLPRPLAATVNGERVRVIGFESDGGEGYFLVINNHGAAHWYRSGRVVFILPLMEQV